MEGPRGQYWDQSCLKSSLMTCTPGYGKLANNTTVGRGSFTRGLCCHPEGRGGEALLCCAGDRALAQAAQWGCASPFLETFRSHLQVALGGPAWAGVGAAGLQRALPPTVVL